MSTAYGSITLVDIGDLGELSVVPQSNLPTLVVYDPDTTTYTPNWQTKHLVLTPVVYYAGSQVQLSSQNITNISWSKREGSSATTIDITSGVDQYGVLTVNAIPFAPDITTVTYLVSVTFVEPNLHQQLTATGTISFGMIQNASSARSINITGESAFLYDAESKAVNQNIVLNCTAINTTILKWQYKNLQGNFVDYAGSVSSITINEDTSRSLFNNDIAVFRVISAENQNLFDEHSIVKLRDGANGNEVISAVLSNDSQNIPCDSEGIPTSYVGAESTITIYEGGTDVTDDWNITVSETNIVGNLIDTTYTVTEITNDIGYVIFTCTKVGHATLTKKFNLAKVKTGVDGISPTIYRININALALNKDLTGQYSPSAVTINAESTTGAITTNYSGRYQIFIDDNTTPYYSSITNEYQYILTPSTANKYYTVKLFKAGGFTELLDIQTIVITTNGNNGDDAYSFLLGNYSDSIPCNDNGSVTADTQIVIPFSVYQGIKRVACSAQVGTLPNGVTMVSNTPGTTLQSGNLVLKFAKDSSLGSQLNGRIEITVSVGDKSNKQIYSWNKNLKGSNGINGSNGKNAIICQLYAPAGNVIKNSNDTIVLQSQLIDGTNVYESGLIYKWYSFNFTTQQYEQIDIESVPTYTVIGSSINSYGLYKCVITYQGNDYNGYCTVYDKTDPIQIELISTIGDKIINNTGAGLIYTRIYQYGESIDEIKTIEYGTTLPQASKYLNKYFYKVNYITHVSELYKSNGSAWSLQNESVLYPHSTYTWNVYDKNNNLLFGPLTSRTIAIDGNAIDDKINIIASVTVDKVSAYANTSIIDLTDRSIDSDLHYYQITSEGFTPSIEDSNWKESSLGIDAPTSLKPILWHYEKVSYSDGTSATIGPNVTGNYAAKGDVGPQGPQGIPGPKGEDGSKAITYKITTTVESPLIYINNDGTKTIQPNTVECEIFTQQEYLDTKVTNPIWSTLLVFGNTTQIIESQSSHNYSTVTGGTITFNLTSIQNDYPQILDGGNVLLIQVYSSDTSDVVATKPLIINNATTQDQMDFTVNSYNIAAAIRDAGMVFDSKGLTLTNGGLTINRTYKKVIDIGEESTETESVLYADDNGNLVVKGIIKAGSLISGTLDAVDGTFTGELRAQTGKIGGFDISNNSLISTDVNQSIELNGSTGKIKANNITLGEGAEIANYINIGSNVRLVNPDVYGNNGQVITIGEGGTPTFELNNKSQMLLGIGDNQIRLDGAASSIYSNTWALTPNKATFNNIYATGELGCVSFKQSTISSVGGGMIFKRSSNFVISGEEDGYTIITLDSDIGLKENDYVLLSSNDVIQDNNLNNISHIQAKILSSTGKITKLNKNIKRNDGKTYNTITFLSESDLNNSAIIGINAEDNNSYNGILPARGITFKNQVKYNSDGTELLYNLNPTLFLGDLNQLKIDYPSININETNIGYGLYGESVYLMGSLTTRLYDGTLAGINTNSVVPATKFKEGQLNDNSNIVFWAGANDISNVPDNEKQIEYIKSIQNAPFQVTKNGSIYANNGIFEGSIITKSTITGSIIRTAKIYGYDAENSTEAALSIYDTAKGIEFKSTDSNNQETILLALNTDGFTRGGQSTPFINLKNNIAEYDGIYAGYYNTSRIGLIKFVHEETGNIGYINIDEKNLISITQESIKMSSGSVTMDGDLTLNGGTNKRSMKYVREDSGNGYNLFIS